MTQKNYVSENENQLSLGKRMLIGAGIGLLLIALFLLAAGEPNPGWRKLWMIRPLIIVPLAGAAGGLCNYFILNYHTLAGINKAVAVIVSVVVFIVGLWLGSVLGLAGTMWN
jgi:hypothetical protein